MAKLPGKKSFLDYFKINDEDEDEFEDDLFDDDEDDFEEEKSFSNKNSSATNRFNNLSNSNISNNITSRATSEKSRPVKTQTNRVVPMGTQKSARSNSEVYVIRPREFDDAQSVADSLKAGRAIVINMEGVELAPAQRIIDFIGGSCYALNGSIQAISGNIFIAAPNNVEVTGDLREEILSDSLPPQLGRF